MDLVVYREDPAVAGELLEDLEREAAQLVDSFFAVMDGDFIDALVADRHKAVAGIEALAETMRNERHVAALSYFLQAQIDPDGRHHNDVNLASLFDVETATKVIDASFWQRALNQTDIYEAMPQKRREEWNNMIRYRKAPQFVEGTVRATMSALLQDRKLFMAERVDGVFRGLSGSHVTNTPEGFYKRMIINYAYDKFGSASTGVSGLVHDLRCVIAKLLGHEDARMASVWALMSDIRRSFNVGSWVEIDGGAMRIKAYKCGTCHIEVHPDVAWQLNAILATLYPLAIPTKRRTRQPRQAKVNVIDTPIHPTLRNALREARTYGHGVHEWTFPLGVHDNKAMLSMLRELLLSIGGAEKPGNARAFVFDYDVKPVLMEISVRGTVPSSRSYQFYPTPAGLAERLVELADIQPGHKCLEPSAGQGGLAAFMPADSTLVELSPLNVSVLEAKGFGQVIQADFLAWAGKAVSSSARYDRIIANPPFDQGRWLAHIEHAATLLATGGKLCAILPAGALGKVIVPGRKHRYHGPYSNEFAGTSVAVVMVEIE